MKIITSRHFKQSGCGRVEIDRRIFLGILGDTLATLKGDVRFVHIRGSSAYNTPNNSRMIHFIHGMSDIDVTVCMDAASGSRSNLSLPVEGVFCGENASKKIPVSINVLPWSAIEIAINGQNSPPHWLFKYFAGIGMPLLGQEEYEKAQREAEQRLLLRVLMSLPQNRDALTASGARALMNRAEIGLDMFRMWNIASALSMSDQRDRNRSICISRTVDAMDELAKKGYLEVLGFRADGEMVYAMSKPHVLHTKDKTPNMLNVETINSKIRNLFSIRCYKTLNGKMSYLIRHILRNGGIAKLKEPFEIDIVEI